MIVAWTQQIFGNGLRNTHYWVLTVWTGLSNFLLPVARSGSPCHPKQQHETQNFANLGSDWSNIAIFSANVNLDTPSAFQSVTPETIPNQVPETGSLALGILGAALLVFWRRRH